MSHSLCPRTALTGALNPRSPHASRSEHVVWLPHGICPAPRRCRRSARHVLPRRETPSVRRHGGFRWLGREVAAPRASPAPQEAVPPLSGGQQQRLRRWEANLVEPKPSCPIVPNASALVSRRHHAGPVPAKSGHPSTAELHCLPLDDHRTQDDVAVNRIETIVSLAAERILDAVEPVWRP